MERIRSVVIIIIIIIIIITSMQFYLRHNLTLHQFSYEMESQV